jgi:hypothetical protein
MKATTKLTRREISVQAALLLLGGATISVSGCSGSGASSDPTPSPSPTPTSGVDRSATSISSNHGHTGVLTGAQLSAGGALTISIQGTSAHNHTVDLTSAEVVQIRNGTQVTKTSGTGAAHTHDVTFN